MTLRRSIPGVGPRTAEVFVACVDDPQRFTRVRRIGAYLGLVPSQDSSAAVNHLGRVTKEGPATLRRLLVQASWRAIDHDPALGQTFERIAAGKPERRKTALRAVAHKLARIMLAMLKSGCVYEPAMTRQTAPNVAA